MSSASRVILAATAIFALCGLASAVQYPLEYKHISKPREEGVHGAMANMDVLANPPKNLELPPGAGSDRVFCRWKTPLAETGFVYVVFSRTGIFAWHDRLFVDTNADGRLSDEKPIEPFLTQGRMDFSHYGPVEMKFSSAGQPLAYHATFSFYAGSSTAWVKPSCWRQADIALGRTTYTLALIDGNVNARFDDASMAIAAADFIALPSEGECIHRCIGRYFECDGQLYLLTVPADGSYVDLAPVDKVQTGTVRTKGHVNYLCLAGETGELSFQLEGDTAEVPAGNWMVKEWAYDGDPSVGRGPDFGDYRFGQPVVFRVVAGAPVDVNVGAADRVSADLTKATNLDALGGYPSDLSLSRGSGVRRTSSRSSGGGGRGGSGGG